MITWKNFETAARLTSGLDAYNLLLTALLERQRAMDEASGKPPGPDWDTVLAPLTGRNPNWGRDVLRGKLIGLTTWLHANTEYFRILDGNGKYREFTWPEAFELIDTGDGMTLPLSRFNTDFPGILIARGDFRYLVTLYRLFNLYRYYRPRKVVFRPFDSASGKEKWVDLNGGSVSYSKSDGGSNTVELSTSPQTEAERARVLNAYLPSAKFYPKQFDWWYDSSAGYSDLVRVKINRTVVIPGELLRNFPIDGMYFTTHYLTRTLYMKINNGDGSRTRTSVNLPALPLVPPSYDASGSIPDRLEVEAEPLDGDWLGWNPEGPFFETSGDDASIVYDSITAPALILWRCVDLGPMLSETSPVAAE